MKPVLINLIHKKSIWGRLSLSLVSILAVTSLGITLVNVYDYYENNKVMAAYESRVGEISRQSELKDRAGQTTEIKKQEREASIKDMAYLDALIKKNLFSLPLVLTEIENAKQDQIDIHSLGFSDHLKVLSIKGESGHMDSVSKFIMELDRSGYFNIELSRQEINKDRKIIFELTAGLGSTEND